MSRGGNWTGTTASFLSVYRRDGTGGGIRKVSGVTQAAKPGGGDIWPRETGSAPAMATLGAARLWGLPPGM